VEPASKPRPGARARLLKALRRVMRGVSYLLTTVLLLLVLVGLTIIVILENPAIQNELLPRANRILSDALKTEVRVGHISIELFDKVVLGHVLIKDQQGDTLLQAEELKVGVLDVRLGNLLLAPKAEHHFGARLVELRNAKLNLYKRKADGKLNLAFLFESDKPKDTTKSPYPGPLFSFDVESVVLNDVDFSFTDSTATAQELAPIPGHLNFRNLKFDNIQFDAGASVFDLQDLAVTIRHLSFHDQTSGVVLSHFSVDAYAALKPDNNPVGRYYAKRFKPDFRLLNTHFVLNGTELNFDLRIQNEYLSTVFSKKGNRNMVFNFRPSVLHFKDIATFIPNTDTIPVYGTIEIEGLVVGNYKRLRSDGLKLKLGDTEMLADVRLTDYTKPNQLFMELDLKPGTVFYARDLVNFLPQIDLPPMLSKAGRMDLDLKYKGFIKDFKTDGSIRTEQGDIVADLHLLLPDQGRPLAYDGQITTTNLNLDSLLGLTNTCPLLNFSGTIKGQGTDLATADLSVAFTAGRTTLMQYTIDSSQGDIRIHDQIIDGKLKVADPQGSFDGVVEVSLADSMRAYEFDGHFTNLDLQHYGVLKQDQILLSAICDIEVAGDSLEALVGKVKLHTIHLENRTKTDALGNLRDLDVKDIAILVDTVGGAGSKNISLKVRNSLKDDLIRFTAGGRFTYTNLVAQVQRLITEQTLFFANNPDSLNNYYDNKARPKLADNLSFQYSLHLGNIQPVMAFLNLPLYVAPNASVTGFFEFADQDLARIAIRADSVAYDTIQVSKIDGQFAFEKPAMVNQIKANGDLNIDRVILPGGTDFQDVRLRPRWYGQEIGYNLHARQDSFRNVFDIMGAANFTDGAIYNAFVADSTVLQIGDNAWRFDPANLLVWTGTQLQITNYNLSSGKQTIALSTHNESEDDTTLNVLLRVQSFSLRSVNNFITSGAGLYGTVNADLDITDLLGEPFYLVNGRINKLQYATINYGDFYIKSDYGKHPETDVNILSVDCGLITKTDTLIAVKGTIDPKSRDLDFTLVRDLGLPVAFVEPFVEGILYDLGGKLQASRNQLTVTGKLDAPIVRGTLHLKDVRLGVEYFKTRFAVSNDVYFNDKNIYFSNIRLNPIDENNKIDQKAWADVRGFIYHKGFSQFQFDLQFTDIRNFTLMNTKYGDNELFYGRAVIKQGLGFITGTPSLIDITADVETGPGSELNIPISSYSESQSLSYVYFKKNVEDEINIQKQEESLGFSLNLTVNATEDASMGIIFDEKTGEKIQGSGNGIINMALTPAGEFNMSGEYTITTGSYLFNLQNVISKTFRVLPGGTIRWDGDPYDAQMDLTTIYSCYSNLNDLIKRGATADTSGKKAANRVPVNVEMNLKGSLMTPEISFGIQLPNMSADQTYMVISTLRMIQNDQQELNKQVFSLLLFQRFAPVGEGLADISAGGGVTSSLSEFVSNQLNNIIGQALGTSNVGVSISSQQFQDVYLNLEARLFNNRVTIQRNGLLVGSGNRDLTLGNISIIIRILPLDDNNNVNSGVLGVEIFNRENIGYNNDITSVNRGAGVFYKKDFDKIIEIFAPGKMHIPFHLQQKLLEQQEKMPQDSSSGGKSGSGWWPQDAQPPVFHPSGGTPPAGDSQPTPGAQPTPVQPAEPPKSKGRKPEPVELPR